jgi:trans-2,3-dihydro-3-hydroxyanthranilate isomerase
LPKLPERLGDAPDIEQIARALGVEVSEIGLENYLPGVYSAGVPFYIVPVRDTQVLARIKPDRRGWYEIFTEQMGAVYAFTATPDELGVEYAARMFSPDMPAGEDPATGAAAAALMGLLAEHSEMIDGKKEFTLRQGAEMGRPSRIELSFSCRDGVMTHAGIGGNAMIVAEGTLLLP